jgi:hypothetical protein
LNKLDISMTSAEPITAAYLARRSVGPQWRGFLRAMVETLDEHLDAEGRAALLRAVGARMAGAMPLAYCDTLVDLEARMNDALAGAEWGFCRLSFDATACRLVITHGAAPAVGTGEDADGAWAGAVLEGLYGAWFAGQPGADGALRPVLASWEPGEAVLHYARVVTAA